MQYIVFCLFRFFGFTLSLLPYSALHAFGRFLGKAAYFCHRSFRKKALSNLAIAYGNSKSEAERKKIALLSFQNLMITCLEFFRIKKSAGKLSEIVVLEENPHVLPLLQQKQGIIFLSAHQANWEIPFIAITDRFPGIAIGRPIKNKRLYNLILSVREMNGGKIVMPKQAIRQGMKALKEGKFLGIVGDQAYPDSPYSYPLLGTRAWTTTTPALLAYKTKSPIVVGTTSRVNGKYIVRGSDPIWPDFSKPIKDDVPRIMDQAMQLLEKSIQEKPEEWMWIHDRWKQQGIDYVKRQYRYGFILVILPKNSEDTQSLCEMIRKIYFRSFITFFVPKGAKRHLSDCDYLEYENEADLFIRDFRFQLVLDFYGSLKLRKHFKKLGAFKTLFFHKSSPEIVKTTLVKRECLTTVSF